MCRKTKINLLFLILIIPLCLSALSRPMAVAGSFYPAGKSELSEKMTKLLGAAKKFSKEDVKAIIVPHAGYIFSADIAAQAYATLNKKYKNVFILGSSHKVSFDGASIYSIGDYVTPLGEVRTNSEIVSSLLKHSKLFKFNPQAHFKEHTIEVQLPFLQKLYKDKLRIVPIILATSNIKTIKEISDILKPYFNDDNLFVISSDLSHYPSGPNADKIDEHTTDAIISNNPLAFIRTLKDNEKSMIPHLVTSACGWSSILTLLNLTQNSDYKYERLAYKNSGDSMYGYDDKVVGYSAIRVYKKRNHALNLSEKEKQDLLNIAELTLYSTTFENKKPDIDESKLSEKLKRPLGAFVTLYKNGILRGCIGTFDQREPLYKVIVDMTVNSAKHDNRFKPVKPNELNDIDIEISVLTPRKRIHSLDEIELGKHGIYIQKGHRSGTFLPHVATDMHWSVEQFVGYCAQEKANIGYDGYKYAKIYTYETITFKMTKKKREKLAK